MRNCFLGPAGNVERLLHSLNLEDKDLRGGPRIEGLFSLDIEDIIAPEFILETSMNVRHSQICDMETLVKWRHDFYVESQGAKPGEESFSRAYEEISRRLEGGELFVLEKNNELLSFCGLGGFLADCKIIGPVWTPHSLRGRGYGRTVTAGALLHARDMGCKKAILFTLNPQAERAYRAIGFERIGDWRVDFPVDFNAEKIKESLVLRRKENEATN